MTYQRVKLYPQPPMREKDMLLYLKSLYTALTEEASARLSDPYFIGDTGPLIIHERSSYQKLSTTIVANGEFTSNIGSWTDSGVNWTWVAGTASHAAGAADTLTQSVSMVSGTAYQVAVFITAAAHAETLDITIGTIGTINADFTAGSYATGVETVIYVHAPTTASRTVTFTPSADAVCTVGYIRIQPIVQNSLPAITLKNTSGETVTELRSGGALGAAAADRNLALGTNALKMAYDATDAIAIGHNALGSLITNYENIAIGNGALATLWSGVRNIAIGSDAASSLISGDSTIAIGHHALEHMTDGYSIAIGDYSLHGLTSGTYGNGDNVAVGCYAGAAATTASENCLFGMDAARAITTGYSNVVIGHAAGWSSVSGHDYALTVDNGAIMIGDRAGRSVLSATALTNYIVIGNGTEIDKSNQVKLGNTSITETNLYGLVRGTAGPTSFDADFDTNDVAVTAIANTDGGEVIVYESVDGVSAIYKIQAGTIAAVSADAAYTNVKDNAGTYNVYFETNVLKVQNKVGNNKSVKVAFYGV